jgi:hypothetical protein
MTEPVILRSAVPAITLDDALLSMSTFPNGCDFRLRFEGRRIFLEWGCYGVHVNLTQGANRALMEWLQSAGRGDRELLPDQIQPETLVELKSRKPCLQCGGFTFKVEN